MPHLRASLATLPTSLLLLQVLLTQPTSVLGDVPFPAAQPCFDSASASAKCDKNSPSFNSCACSNTGNWLGNSAQCIGASDSSQLTKIYNTLASNCAGSNTPIAYSLDKWLAAAKGSAATTSQNSASSVKPAAPSSAITSVTTTSVLSTISLQPTPTDSSSGSSTSNPVQGSPAAASSVITVTHSTTATATPIYTGKSGSKLSTGAIVGIVVGALLLLALIGLILFLYRRRKTSQVFSSEESEFVAQPEVGPTKRPFSTATALSEPVSQMSDQTKRFSAQQTAGFQAPPAPSTGLYQPPEQGPDSGFYSRSYHPTAHELQGPPAPRLYELPTTQYPHS